MRTSRLIGLVVRALAPCALALLPLLAACGGGTDARTVPIAAKAEPKPAPAPATDEALAGKYLEIKERFAALTPEDKAGPGRILGEAGAELRRVAETAGDPHLRANASLLLGTLYEATGDPRSAISFYRQAASLLPTEAAPRRVLAMALAADKQFAAALPEQQKVVEDDPDDLEAWLLLGEVAVKAGEKDQATQAYAAYEMRRKGLIDGITLKKPEGTFTLPPDQRAACARALIPARDNGTAIALLYALEIETEPAVRAAIVEAMGTQRLAGYKAPLEAKLAKESAQEVKEAMIWALAEIQRDPLDARPGPAPLDPDAPAGAAGHVPGDMAAGTGPAGQGAKDMAAGTGPAGQAAPADAKAATPGAADAAAGTPPPPR